MNIFKKLRQKYIFNFGSTKKRFEEIYRTNFWNSGESISGPGSQLDQTETIRKELPKIIKNLNITSILDIPCGDYNWMKHVDLHDISYIGGDIVPDLIIKNNSKYKNEKVHFQNLDIISSNLPKVDAILVRDCFIHLSEKQILDALKNISFSDIKYLITNNYPDFLKNFDIKTGMFRKVNLTKSPFNLPNPYYESEEKEHYSEVDGRKMIVVYDCSQLISNK